MSNKGERTQDMKKRILRFLSAALAAVLVVTALPAESAFAVLSEVNDPAQVTSFKSTTDFEKEYVRAYVTDDSVLKINYKTPLQTTLFRVSLYRVGENKGDIDLDIFVDAKLSTASDGTQLYGFTYYLDMERFEVPNGYYNLYLRRCATEADAQTLNYKSSGVLYKNMEIKVTNGKVKILRYKDVINYNDSIRQIGELYSIDRYLDNTLEDIRFVLRNPATNIYATMTSSKISFIKTVSDRITAGASSDYEKLLKIYEYTASNFYYDSVAFSTHSYQYADPYENIYNHEYGRSSANSVSGRVHTTCQGFSAIYLALARAQGIPTRFVYGHRLAIPSNDWLTEDNIDVRDHWWAESYVNGKWIFVDPTVGTTNKYNKSTGEWTYTGLTNYTYFDPSDEQIATSHVYMNIYPDYRYGKYIDDEYEMSMLREFFGQTARDSASYDSSDYYGSYSSDLYKTNGTRLNSSYSAYDTETWGDGTKSHFMTNGKGKTSQIQWSNKGLNGSLNLSGFTKLTLLSSHHNNYDTANLSNSPQLKKVYLQNNNLTSVDLTNCYKLSYVRAQDNPMKSFALYVNGSNRSFTAGENGTFYFTLDTAYKNSSLSLYSKPDIGYKVDGVYSTYSGSRLSTSKTYHFTPKASAYEVRFKLDPNSYKYYLKTDEARSSRLPYIQAVAKRLNALGYYKADGSTYSYYYSSSTVGEETSYTTELAEAVTKFQVMNDVSNTGNVGEQTWSALFNDSAKSMVSDYEYAQILAEYEQNKLLRSEATEQMSLVKLKAASTASKGAITLTWSVSVPNTELNDSDLSYDEIADYDNSVLGNVSADEILSQIDGYELWKSTFKTSGYTLLKDSTKFKFKNTSKLTKGTRYYYKVRAYREIGGKRIYSDWSNITYKKAK